MLQQSTFSPCCFGYISPGPALVSFPGLHWTLSQGACPKACHRVAMAFELWTPCRCRAWIVRRSALVLYQCLSSWKHASRPRCPDWTLDSFPGARVVNHSGPRCPSCNKEKKAGLKNMAFSFQTHACFPVSSAPARWSAVFSSVHPLYDLTETPKAFRPPSYLSPRCFFSTGPRFPTLARGGDTSCTRHDMSS